MGIYLKWEMPPENMDPRTGEKENGFAKLLLWGTHLDTLCCYAIS